MVLTLSLSAVLWEEWLIAYTHNTFPPRTFKQVTITFLHTNLMQGRSAQNGTSNICCGVVGKWKQKKSTFFKLNCFTNNSLSIKAPFMIWGGHISNLPRMIIRKLHDLNIWKHLPTNTKFSVSMEHMHIKIAWPFTAISPVFVFGHNIHRRQCNSYFSKNSSKFNNIFMLCFHGYSAFKENYDAPTR